MTRRIAHFVKKMDVGGTETLLMNIYRNIDRNRFQFDFVVETEDTGFYDKEIIELGGKVIPLKNSPQSGVFRYIESLKQVFQNGNFYGIHSHIHLLSGLVLGVASSYPIPIRIAHSHTIDLKQSSFFRKWGYRPIMKILIEKCAMHKLSCSIPAGNDLFLNKKNTTIIKNAININRFLFPTFNRVEIRRKFKIGKNVFVVGHIGRFHTEKNHAFLLEIFEQVVQMNMNSLLVLVGDGPLLNDIKRVVINKKLENHVLFLGLQTDIASITGLFDIVVFPSRVEGLGMVLIEAQASGLPIVAASNIPHEVDVGLKLVSFLPLDGQESYKNWAREVILKGNDRIEDAAIRKEKLMKSGYDLSDVVRQYEALYETV